MTANQNYTLQRSWENSLCLEERLWLLFIPTLELVSFCFIPQHHATYLYKIGTCLCMVPLALTGCITENYIPHGYIKYDNNGLAKALLSHWNQMKYHTLYVASPHTWQSNINNILLGQTCWYTWFCIMTIRDYLSASGTLIQDNTIVICCINDINNNRL